MIQSLTHLAVKLVLFLCDCDVVFERTLYSKRKIGIVWPTIRVQIEALSVETNGKSSVRAQFLVNLILPIAIEESLTQRLVLWDRLEDFSVGRYIADRPLTQTGT